MSTTSQLRGKYVIADMGATAFGKLGQDKLTLHATARAGALADAGMIQRRHMIEHGTPPAAFGRKDIPSNLRRGSTAFVRRHLVVPRRRL